MNELLNSFFFDVIRYSKETTFKKEIKKKRKRERKMRGELIATKGRISRKSVKVFCQKSLIARHTRKPRGSVYRAWFTRAIPRETQRTGSS